MINRQLFAELNGCISTGKEANVYHACRADGTEHAVKVGLLLLYGYFTCYFHFKSV